MQRATQPVLIMGSLLLAAAALIGCEELDPVRSVDLCKGRDVISANCPVCLQPKYAAACPQCKGAEPNADCMPETGQSSGPSMSSDAGPGGAAANGGDAAAPGSGGMSGGESGNGAPSGQPGPDGQPGRDGQPGANGMPGSNGANPNGTMAGASGGGAGAGGQGPSPWCGIDADCPAATPACSYATRSCVPCVENKHCKDGSVCDSDRAVCVGCKVNSDCKGDKPVCNTSQNECVPCLEDYQCNADPLLATCSTKLECVDCAEGKGGCDEPGKPACVGNVCLQCSNDTQCSKPTPRCVIDQHTCAECLGDADCADTGNPRCDMAAKKCVQCFADNDCKDPGASHCDANKCVACTANVQCDHLSDTPVCDPGKSCVECLNNTTCGDNACIIKSHKCSTVKFRSLQPCSPCETDGECRSTAYCVPMTFAGKSLGNFCAIDSATNTNCISNPPYSQTVQVASVDGFSRKYCLPPPSTTCAAIADAISAKSCGTNASLCGEPNVADGTCSETTGACTYNCAKGTAAPNQDCPPGFTCQDNLMCGR